MKRKNFYLILFFAMLLSSSNMYGRINEADTTSPRLLHTAAEISFVKTKVALSQQPWKDAYDDLIDIADGYASRTQEAVDTFRVPKFYNDPVGNRIAKTKLITDAHAAYASALAYQLTNDTVYAKKAVYFLNAWATGNRVISRREDAPLVTASCGWVLIQAADLVLGAPQWTDDDIVTFKTWLANVYLPIVEEIRTKENNWGDWATLASVSAYVILDDTAKLTAAVDSMKVRIGRSIAADGHMPAETAREENGLWYTFFALTPMTLSARIALHTKGIDLYHWQSDSARSIKKALDYYFYYNSHKSLWPWYTMPAGSPQDKDEPISLLEAMNDHYEGQYEDYVKAFRPALGGYKGTDLTYLPWVFPTLMRTWEPSPLQPDHIVVSRAGSGAETLDVTTASIYLDEYTGSGDRTRVTGLPVQTVSSNYRLTAIGNSGYEGLLARSGDGQYLTIAGYDAATGSTPTNSTKRVMALIDANGTINSSTAFTTSSVNPRSVVTNDGSAFWFGGGGAGIRYAAAGAGSATTISTFPSSSRSVYVFNNQLYAVTNSSGMRIATVGSGLPSSTGQTLTGLPGIPADGLTANQMLLFDTDTDGEPDLLYFVNDGSTSPATAAIRKYALNSSGTSWVAKGSFSSAGLTEGLKGITGKMNGDTVTLYTVTMGNAATNTVSALLKVVDNNKANDISVTIPMISVLATAAFQTAFKGVALSPESSSSSARNYRMAKPVQAVSPPAGLSFRIAASGNERIAVVNMDYSSAASMQLFNMNGERVANLGLQLSKGYNSVVLPVSLLAPGVYIATLVDAKGSRSVKFYK